jgi:WD40 repeat protein
MRNAQSVLVLAESSSQPICEARILKAKLAALFLVVLANATPAVAKEEQTTLRGFSAPVRAVAFSPDGKLLATCCFDGKVGLWHVAKKQEIKSFKDSDGYDLCFAPNGKTLAVAGAKVAHVRLWDLDKNKLSVTIEILQGGPSLAFAPDAKTLATGTDKLVKLWDPTTGKERATLKGHQSSITALAYTRDGKLLASGDEGGTVKLWDVATKKVHATIEGYSKEILSVSFSPDGKLLATGAAFDPDTKEPHVKLWDVTKGSELASLKNPCFLAKCVRFSTDGKLLAVGGAPDLIIWDVPTRKFRAQLKGHKGDISGIAFSPDGKTIATGSGDKTVRFWEVPTAK